MSKTILKDAIKAKIQALDGFNWEGLFNNQFAQEAQEDPIRYPAVFLEFSLIGWADSAGTYKNLQKGNIEVTLWIGFKTLDKENEDVLDLVDEIYKELHGHGTDDFKPLRRIREVQDVDYNNVIVWAQTYRTELRDCGAANKDVTVVNPDSLDVRTESVLIIEPDNEDNKIVRTASKEYADNQ